MAKKSGVWNLQQVRDKLLQSLWDYDTYAVEGSGELFGWGRNSAGDLAQNNINAPSVNGLSSPVQIPGTTWNYVRGGSNPGGYDTCIGTKSDGTLWQWGQNEEGQFGQNNTTDYSSPVQVGSDTTWAYPNSAAGTKQCGAVKTDGTLWIWGDNEYGTLGQNNTTHYSSPVQVGSDTTWSTDINMFAMRSTGCYAIKTDGTLWSWGANSSGCLAINQPANINFSSPTQVPGTTWKEVNASQNLFAGIKTDGTLWICGDNNDNQQMNGLPSNTHISSPVQVPGTDWNHTYSGKYAYYAIKTGGTLWGWGYNGYGQLGQNQQGNSLTSPHQIPGTTWKLVSGASYFIGGIKTDGTLWMWGENEFGVLGQGGSPTASRSSPVQVPGTDWNWCSAASYQMVMYATKTNGELWGWGRNGSGELGLNTVVSYSSPVQIPGDWMGVVGGYGGGIGFKA